MKNPESEGRWFLLGRPLDRSRVQTLQTLQLIDKGRAEEHHHQKFLMIEYDMDGTACPTLFPSHRCKIVHLVRHAQGIHNVEGDEDRKAYLSPAFFYAHLTPLGWQQVDNQHKHVHTCGLDKRIDLVITSPLLRAMQTAVGVFGGNGCEDGIDVPPLMVANVGNSDRSAYSSSGCPTFIALETVSRILGMYPNI